MAPPCWLVGFHPGEGNAQNILLCQANPIICQQPRQVVERKAGELLASSYFFQMLQCKLMAFFLHLTQIKPLGCQLHTQDIAGFQVFDQEDGTRVRSCWNNEEICCVENITDISHGEHHPASSEVGQDLSQTNAGQALQGELPFLMLRCIGEEAVEVFGSCSQHRPTDWELTSLTN